MSLCSQLNDEATMKNTSKFIFSVAIFAPTLTISAQETNPTVRALYEKVQGKIDAKTIEDLLVDSAAGTVTAAGLAGVDSDSVAVIENVRDFALIFGGFGKDTKGFGLAITPARTTMPFPAITLQNYAKPSAHIDRLLGALTFSYAQGKSDLAGKSYTRNAYAVGSSAFWSPEDDPLVAVANAKECTAAAFDKISDKPSITADEAKLLLDLKRKSESGDLNAKAIPSKWDRKDGRIDSDQEKAALNAFNACAAELLVEHGKKWNRSRYSFSYVEGSIKATEGGGGSSNLGRTFAFNLLYGFDGIGALKDRAAVSVTARRSQKEPIVSTLGSTALQTKNTTLLAIRFAGGSSTFRALIEASKVQSASSDIALSERVFKQAIGLDYRITKGVWLNLRSGKQRKLSGEGDETGSLLTLNWSPSALLGH
jgi:hypothetical protein